MQLSRRQLIQFAVKAGLLATLAPMVPATAQHRSRGLADMPGLLTCIR